MGNPRKNKDLAYCKALLIILDDLEENEKKRKGAVKIFEQKKARNRLITGFCLAFLTAAIVFAVLLLMNVFLTVSFFIATLIFVGAARLYFNFLNKEQSQFFSTLVEKRQQLVLDEKLEKIDAEKIRLRALLPVERRITEQFFNARDVRLLTRYFERQEANQLSDALHFLSLDLKNNERD